MQYYGKRCFVCEENMRKCFGDPPIFMINFCFDWIPLLFILTGENQEPSTLV